MGCFDWLLSGFNIFTIAVLPWLIFNGWSAVRRSTLVLLIGTAALSNLLLGASRNVITAGGFASGTAWSFGGLAMVWFGQLIPAVLTPIILGGAVAGFVSSPVRLQFASFFAILTFSYIILTFIAPAFVEATPFMQVIIRVVIYTMLLEIAIATVRVCTKASFSRHIPRDRTLALVGPTLLVAGMTGRFLSTSMDTLGETIGVAAAISVTELTLRLTLPSRDRVLLGWCLKWCPCLWQDRVRRTDPAEDEARLEASKKENGPNPSPTASSRAGSDVMPLAAAVDRSTSIDDTTPSNMALAARQQRLMSTEDDPSEQYGVSPANRTRTLDDISEGKAAAPHSSQDLNSNPLASSTDASNKGKVGPDSPTFGASSTQQMDDTAPPPPSSSGQEYKAPPSHLAPPTVVTHPPIELQADKPGAGSSKRNFADIVLSTRAVRVGAAVQMAMRRTAREAQDIHSYFTMLTLDTMAEDIGILTSLPFALLMRLPPRVGGAPLTVGDILARIGGQYVLELLTDIAPPLLMLGVNVCCGVRWRRVTSRAVRRTVREEMLKAQLPQNDDGVERVLMETPIAGSRGSRLTESDVASASAQMDALDERNSERDETGDENDEHESEHSPSAPLDEETGLTESAVATMDMQQVSSARGTSSSDDMPAVPPMPGLGSSAHMALRLAAQQSEFVAANGSVRSPGGNSPGGFRPQVAGDSDPEGEEGGAAKRTTAAAVLRGTYVSGEKGTMDDGLSADLRESNGREVGPCDVMLRKGDPDVVAHRRELQKSYKAEIRRIHRDALWQPIEKQQLLALAIEGYSDPLVPLGRVAQPALGAGTAAADSGRGSTEGADEEPAMVLWQPVYRVADLSPMQRWVAWLSISSEVLSVRLGRAWETRFRGFTRLFLIGVISAVLLNARNFAGPFLRCKLMDGEGKIYFDFCDDQNI